VELWRACLSDKLPDSERTRIAGLYSVGIGAIGRAARAARELAAFEGAPLGPRHVKKGLDQQFQSDLMSVATPVEVKQSWADIVLPDDLAAAITSIVDRVRHRATVLGDWGFDRKLGKGLGILVLLSGQPGTGKSMAAGLVAKELGVDLQVIDLSLVVSKWLGETEKNLRRAFDAAEAGHVLLLFDEADTLLGKRTSDIKSSNDRYANMETNFILSRLESFNGIAFFTTNAVSSIDQAVIRRMSLHLQFPFPDEQARAEMWRRMIPKDAPVSPDIDFQHLGERFRISGGIIRNIVLRAAFLAASAGQPISMGHLVHCTELEYRDRGHAVVGGLVDLA
jgi:SpoVK/Ycf46/Vps4 family AAA+-type ATPase